jgi:hypothetical protein
MSKIFSENYFKNTASQEGWKEEDFNRTTEKLEQMDRKQLVQVCKHPSIQFSFGEDWEENVPEEEMILALMADCKPDVLKSVVENA